MSTSGKDTKESDWDSLIKRFHRNGQDLPNKTAVSFLQSAGDKTPTVSSSWTYHRLNSAVEYFAARLLPPEGANASEPPLIQQTLEKGDRVLIVYPPCSPHFLITFLACLRAGLVAVPVYPPHPDRKDSLGAFAGIVRECSARVALTNGEYANAKRLGQLKNNFMSKLGKKNGENVEDAKWPENLQWIVTDKEPLRNLPTEFPRVKEEPGPEDIAFLQFTSGSTSAPKGVTLTHANLSHNLHVITNELKAGQETVVVSWLPQYHDMGLIGSLLGILYCGGSGYYMSPIAFLQRPMAWMEAVSEYRATHLQAPNFAFGLTARKFEPNRYYHDTGDEKNNEDGKKTKPLDLSCLEHIINGAEPVTMKSMRAYEKSFEPFGLRTNPSVIFPTYGLAEHTVFVCSGGRGTIQVKKKKLEEENRVVIVDDGAASDQSEASEPIVTLAGCGFPQSQNIDVRIVEPEERRLLPDDRVGEIWVNSPSKALKYYGRNDVETKDDFHAVITGSKDYLMKCGGYLRTGDLGFMHKDQLYVCARIKDLIIISGKNHYPQDLEATAESIVSEYVRPGCSAAFSTGTKSGATSDSEQVVLAMELKEPVHKGDNLTSVCESIASKVRSEVFKEHALALESIVLLKARTIPKTTSGKIQRSKTRVAFFNKSLQELYRKNFDSSAIGDYNATLLATDGSTNTPTVRATAITKTPDEIRALAHKEIKAMLIDSISQIAQISKNDIKDNIALSTIMDSLSLAQFKGLLENTYGVKAFSDEYLFRDTTTLKKLVNVVKAGFALDDGDGSVAVATTAVGSGSPGCCGCVVM